MLGSILGTIRTLVVGCDCDNSFDEELIVNINSSLSILTQVGVGPPSGFRIEDERDMWEDFIGDFNDLDMVKTYVYLKAKIVFDPSASAVITNSRKEEAAELLWRIEDTVFNHSKESGVNTNDCD